MDILFLNYNKTHACSFYRSAGVAKDLRHRTGHNIIVAEWRAVEMNWSMIQDFDIIMFQRPYGKQALDLCKFIKTNRVPLWLDYDDNLLCVPPENPAFSTYSDPAVQDSIKEMLKLADVVTVTSSDLRDDWLKYNNNIAIIPNAFNDIVFRRDMKPKERSNIVLWRGTPSHVYDMMRYGQSISKAAKDFPDKQFLFMGFYPWMLPDTDNLAYMPEMDIMLYFSNLYQMAPALIHVPLFNSLFNHCKSNIALLEGAYFGCNCVVPDWPDWKIPGALNYNSPESYYEMMRAALAGEIDLQVNNRLMWEYIMDHLRLSIVNVRRMDIINSLV